jgi:hypothetical protein
VECRGVGGRRGDRVVGLARAAVDGSGAAGVRRVPRVMGTGGAGRFPRRGPGPDRTFPRRGPGRRGSAANAPRCLDRDRWRPPRRRRGCGAAGGGAVLAQARREPGGDGGGEPWPRRPPRRALGGGPDVPPTGDHRARGPAGRSDLPRVARRGGGQRGAVDARPVG